MLRKMPLKERKRLARKVHIRKRIRGTAAKPRLSVFRSNRAIYAQVIDDVKGETLVSASTGEVDISAKGKSVEGGTALGEALGKRLLEKGIKEVVFDRNGYLYHGRVKAVAEGARKAGLVF